MEFQKRKPTNFFRNINQRFRKDRAQCTKSKQGVHKIEKKKKIERYAKQNKEKIKQNKKNRRKTDNNFRINDKTRSRVYKALKNIKTFFNE